VTIVFESLFKRSADAIEVRLCGPHSCSMKITEVVRKYAAEQCIAEEQELKRGMEAKSKEFVEKGAGVYKA